MFWNANVGVCVICERKTNTEPSSRLKPAPRRTDRYSCYQLAPPIGTTPVVLRVRLASLFALDSDPLNSVVCGWDKVELCMHLSCSLR